MTTAKKPDSCNRRSGALALALLGGASVLIHVSPALAQSASVAAQDAASASPQSSSADNPAKAEEVIVTGTRIGGVSPVGSSLVQVSQQEIKATGLTSTADILNTVPSILSIGSGNAYAGGQAQQGNTLNSFTYGKSPNIHGLGVGATLSLVNGHRMPYEGGNMNSFDGDNYPGQMLERIDVVEDGGSALYGADAIAGTVNYILRKPENTLEVYGGYGTNDGNQDSYFVTAIGGVTWNDGDSGIIASYQHSYQQAFKASSRPDLYNDDLSPFGGPASPLFSAPGNVLVGDTYYSIPTGQDGQNLTLSDLGTTPNRLNTWTRIDIIPQVEADRFSANFKQTVTDWLSLFGDALYVRRDIAINGPNSSTSNRVTRFGAMPQIPNSNPYSPCNPSHYPGGIVTGPAELVAACDAGSLAIAYNSVYDIGPPTRTSVTKTWSYGGGAKIDLPQDWALTLTAYAGTSDAPSITTQTGGAPVPNFATFNFFCDPTQFQCTDPATAAAINATGTSLINRTKYTMQDYAANANGALFSLPAGKVKLAVGFERYRGTLLNQNNFGGNNLNHRNVTSVYGELFVPIISPEFAIPAINKLELDISGRYDDYSDAGGTKNPRIGLNWWPTEALKIFASYGTSFRAPGLADNDPYSQTGVIPGVASGSQISSSICAACQLPGFVNAAIYQTIGGANRDLTPETSKNFSLGAEWKPKGSGFVASVKYWWIDYEGQVNAPAYNVGTIAAINRGIYNSQIIYNPALFPDLAVNNPEAFFGKFPTINAGNAACAAALGQKVVTQGLFDSMINCFNTGGEIGGLFGAPSDPSKVLAVVNGRRINAGTTKGDGIDVNLSYGFDNDLGSWRLGAVASYIRGWRVAPIQGAPLVEEVNEFGNPLRFRGRAQVGWNRDFSFGHLLANIFINYTNAYKMDLAQLPVGVPASYAHIGSYTTFDLTLGYDTRSLLGSWIAKDVGVTLSVQNLFNTDPPLVVNQAGLAGSSLRFDPTYGSPLGRVVQIQLSKKF